MQKIIEINITSPCFFINEINNISIPLKIGDSIGTIDAYLKNKIITSSNLTVDRNVNKISFTKLYRKTITDMISGIY